MTEHKGAMLELAERCEREPASGELDALIARAVRHPISATGTVLPDWVHKNFPEWEVLSGGRLKAGCIWEAPRFTSSVEAAWTLVPKGCGLIVEHGWSDGDMPECCIALAPEQRDWEDQKRVGGRASTISQAIVAASLRALSESGR